MSDRRPLTAIPAILALLGAGGIAAVEERFRGADDQVKLDTLRQMREAAMAVLPGGRLRWDEDRIRLHPKAMAAAGWDSNVRNVRDGARGDAFAALTAGADLHAEPGERDLLIADAEVYLKRYHREAGARMTGGNLWLEWDHHEDTFDGWTGAGLRRLEDPLAQSGQPLARTEGEGQARGTWTWYANALQVDGGAGTIDYVQDASDFSRNERDAAWWRVKAGWRWQGGQISELRAGVLADGWEYRDPGSRFQDSAGVTPSLGGRLATGWHSGFEAEAGWQARRYDHDFAGDPAYRDRRVSGPVGGLSWGWEWEKRSHVRLGAWRTSIEGTESNALHAYEARAEVRYRLGWETAVQAEWRSRQLRDSGRAEGAPDHRRRIHEATLTFERILTQGMVVRAGVHGILRQSNLDDDYRRVVATLEFGVVL